VTALVETSGVHGGRQLWTQRLVIGAVLLCLCGLVAWAGFAISHHGGGPQRQLARIALLPDTPPPPPPPPPQEKPKIEPKNETKQLDKPKVETPPQPEPLKMEGQAGEGPSPFTAGEVKNDYIGGDIGNGRFVAYVGRVAQIIQDEIARRKLRVPSARVFVWLTPDGAIQRYEINGASGDVEQNLRTAMAGITRLPEAPPSDMPMPVGLEISER
jgi:periplasmic protein TonB